MARLRPQVLLLVGLLAGSLLLGFLLPSSPGSLGPRRTLPSLVALPHVAGPTVTVTGAPNATDEGSLVAFHAVVQGGTPPYNVTWRFSQGGGPSYGAWVNRSFPSAGNTTATAWANDSASATANASATVVVHPVPTAGLFFRADPTDVGVADLATAVPYEGTPPFSYAWDLGDGTTGTGVSVQHTYLTAGTYDVRLNATDAVGVSVHQTEVLEVLDPPISPTLTISPSVLDLGGTTTLNASVTAGSPPFHAWFSGLPPGCGEGNGPPLLCVPASAGNYSITVFLQDQAGANVSASASLAVEPLPRVLAFAATPSSVVQGSAATFELAADGGTGGLTVSYVGLPGGCSSANRTTLLCVPSSVGNYTVVATVTDREGQRANASLVLQVQAPSPPPVGGGPPPGGNTSHGPPPGGANATASTFHESWVALAIDTALATVLAALVAAYVLSPRLRRPRGRGPRSSEPGRATSGRGGPKRRPPLKAPEADGDEEMDAPVR